MEEDSDAISLAARSLPQAGVRFSQSASIPASVDQSGGGAPGEERRRRDYARFASDLKKAAELLG